MIPWHIHLGLNPFHLFQGEGGRGQGPRPSNMQHQIRATTMLASLIVLETSISATFAQELLVLGSIALATAVNKPYQGLPEVNILLTTSDAAPFYTL